MRLHVHRWGGEGVPVVALHGFTGSGRDFEPLVDRRPWVAPDLPGHGRSSDPPDYTMGDVIAALGEVVPDRFVLLGYSLGGRVALHAALAWGDRVDRLVLVGATAGIEGAAAREARRLADAALADRILDRGVPWFADHWAQVPIIASQQGIAPEIRGPMQARRLRNRASGLAGSLRSLGAGATEPMWDRLGEIAAPVVLVTGERDEKYGAIAARMRGAFRRARHVVVPGVGHCAHLEAPGVFRGLTG